MRGSKWLLWSTLVSLAVVIGQGQAWAWPSAQRPGQGQDNPAATQEAKASASSPSGAASSTPTTVVVVAPRVATPDHPTAALPPQMRAYLFTNGGGGAAKDCSNLFTDMIIANGDDTQLNPTDLACLGRSAGAGPGMSPGRLEIQLTDYDYRFGMEALKAKDYAKAMKLFMIVYTQKGLPAGGIMVAKMHLYGLGVPKSTPEAISWFQMVLDDSRNQQQPKPFDPANPEVLEPYAEAAVCLGQIYMSGFGIDKDLPRARRYYEQADRLGAVPATYILGMLWVEGIGGAQNTPKGVGFVKQAAEVGYPPAEAYIGKAYYEGTQGVAQDRKKGWSYLLDAATRKNADALYAVGAIYDQSGDGTAPDHKKALVYYRDAVLQNQPEAEEALGLAFYLGQDVPRNLATARGLFKLAADQGEPDAMFDLAVMEARGEGGDRDMVGAYALFVQAQRQGLDKAQAAAKEIEPALTAADRVKVDRMLSGVAQ